jgi:hypothetical protein
VTSSSYQDVTVSPGAVYVYAVRARDAAGNVSPASAPVSLTVPAQPGTIFSDGFESGSMSAWTSVSQVTVRSGDAHSGSWAAEAQSTTSTRGFASALLPGAYDAVSVGAWFKVVSQSTTMNLLRLQSPSGANIATVFVGSRGNLMLRNDTRGVSVWSPRTVTKGTWHEIQVRVTVAGASSQTEVWYDGQRVAELSLTQDLGSLAVGRLILGDNVSGRTHRVLFDDVVVSSG